MSTELSNYEVLDECDEASLYAERMNDMGVQAVLANMPKGRLPRYTNAWLQPGWTSTRASAWCALTGI